MVGTFNVSSHGYVGRVIIVVPVDGGDAVAGPSGELDFISLLGWIADADPAMADEVAILAGRGGDQGGSGQRQGSQ